MPVKIEDLWPDLGASAIVTPAAILKTQATALSQKTKGLLQGEVTTWANSGSIYHRFNLLVPALDNYRYGLLAVHHSPVLYPIVVDDGPSGVPQLKLQDEGELRDWLRQAFSAPNTKRVLEALLAQAAS